MQDHINPLAENHTNVKLISLQFFEGIKNILNALTINMLYQLPYEVLEEADRFRHKLNLDEFQRNIFDNIWDEIEQYQNEANYQQNHANELELRYKT